MLSALRRLFGRRDAESSSAWSEKSRRALESAGVIFGEEVEGDDIFRHASLPPGWKKVGSDHAMWSDLVDERGRVRARIFFKDAFYDRSAHMYAVPRFSFRNMNYDKPYSPSVVEESVTVVIVDCGVDTAHTFTAERDVDHGPSESAWGANSTGVTFETADASTRLSRAAEVSCAAARAWLDENLPEWEDLSAYWGE